MRSSSLASRQKSTQNRDAGGGSNSSETKFGGGALLRTKHIDTLEVLEEYTRDIDRLQKENKALQKQITQLVSTGHTHRERERQAQFPNIHDAPPLTCHI